MVFPHYITLEQANHPLMMNSTIVDNKLTDKLADKFAIPAFEPAITVATKPSLINGVPDGVLALIAPVVAYWSFSLIFHLLDIYKLAESHRIHPSEEMKRRNKAGRMEVLREVILQHLIQSAVGLLTLKIDSGSIHQVTGYEDHTVWQWKQALYRLMGPHLINHYVNDKWIHYIYHYGALSLVKILVAFIFVDTWQFFLHYAMHYWPSLYRKFHSRHHQLYVPYAYGALFNHPFEGFLLDTLGTGIAMMITRLTAREQIWLYTLATMKTVDDHCGFVLPWDPFQWVFPNNAVYHDIHHQEWGLKYNFAQPFFTFWDAIFKTRFPQMETELKHKDGRHVSIKQYKWFLQNRDKETATKLAKLKESLAKEM